MQDHPDDKALLILKRLKEALGPQSVIFIDELVLRDTGASRMSLESDFAVMAVLSGMERTEAHWHNLLGQAGLEVERIHRYDPGFGFAILQVIAKK